MNQQDKNDRLAKVLIIASFTFIVLALMIIAKTPQSSGYEISIYGAYPWYLWLFIIIAQIISICIIVFSVEYYTKYWKYALLAIFMNYSILFHIPSIRGYFSFANVAWDIFTHLSEINYIHNTGHLSEKLLYPIMHILTTELILIKGEMQITDLNSILAMFSLIYILFFYILGKEISKNHVGSMFFLAFAIPLMFSFLHATFIPYSLALFFFPILLYSIHKRSESKNKIEFSFITLVLIFFVIYFHPLIAVLLLFVLIGFQLLYLFKYNSFDFSIHTNVTLLLAFMFTSFLAWYLNFSSILSTINKIYNTIFGIGQETIVGDQLNVLESSTASIYTLIEIFIKIYSSITIYILMACLCLIFVVIKMKKKQATYHETVYSVLFVLSIMISIFIFNVTSVVFEPIRAISSVLIIGAILCGVVFYTNFETIQPRPMRNIILLCIAIVIVFSSIAGMFNIYFSPWIGTPSPHMTHMNADGLDWYIDSNDNTIPLIANFRSIKKYEYYYYSRNTEIDHWTPILVEKSIPSHFGYETNQTVAESFNYSNRYMITTELIKQLPSAGLAAELIKKYPHYTDFDFNLLVDDVTVDKLYMNGEFEIWIT